MRILVLGSEGVIGKSLCKKLEKSGHEVTKKDIVIDISHDLRRPQESYSYFDFVFFLAYDVGGSKYLENSNLDFINNNVDIMKHTFEALKGTRFIFASSQMQNMYNSYGALKSLGEHYTTILGGKSVRFWNIYGPEEVNIKSHVIPDFIEQSKSGTINMMTDGTELRQFLYTQDCSECLEIIMNQYDTMKNIIDISSFEWVSIHDVAKMICDNVTPGEVISSLQTENQPDPYILQFWKPKTSLQQGIKLLVQSIDETQHCHIHHL